MQLLLHALKSAHLNSSEVLTNLIPGIWRKISKDNILHSTCLELLHLRFPSSHQGICSLPLPIHEQTYELPLLHSTVFSYCFCLCLPSQCNSLHPAEKDIGRCKPYRVLQTCHLLITTSIPMIFMHTTITPVGCLFPTFIPNSMLLSYLSFLRGAVLGLGAV